MGFRVLGLLGVEGLGVFQGFEFGVFEDWALEGLGFGVWGPELWFGV